MKKILLVGDSITEGFKTDLLLPELRILNKGIYGDNSEGVLNRVYKDVIAEKPDVVYILIGTNDFALGRSDEELLLTLEKIAAALKEGLTGSEIILTSILPTRNIENRPNERINSVNKLIHHLCKKLNLIYFNLNEEMKDETGSLKKEFTDDGLHLTEAAYEKWADILRKKYPNF